MPSISPHHSAAMHNSPYGSSTNARRPQPMKRHGSQSSNSGRIGTISPGAGLEHQLLRHHVKPAKHAKIVLPRNHSSARNLAKLARQMQVTQVVEESRKLAHTRHESNSEIRLPGSLDETRQSPIKRSLTSSQLTRNTSHTKLKKNFSHGQLTRPGSGRNLVGLTYTGSRPAPAQAAKGKSRRPKSADSNVDGMDLHQQEVELERQMREQKQSPRKVGFDVGSAGDSSDVDERPQMEGSGLQEDEWTDQSGSASPETTRQNTASNSRRTSISLDKPPDRRAFHDAINASDTSNTPSRRGLEQESQIGTDETPRASPENDSNSKTGAPSLPQGQSGSSADTLITNQSSDLPQSRQKTDDSRASRRSSAYSTKQHLNPTTKHLLTRSNQSKAPALVSNVNALDDVHSARVSPELSLKSSRSNIGDGAADQEDDELVSRFIPSTSNPVVGSANHMTMSTSKPASLETSGHADIVASQKRGQSMSAFQIGPNSPGSTVSGSSGAATPALGISRTELRLRNEKFMADMEDAAAMNPSFPTHKFDRRNESLKSYLHIADNFADGKRGTHTKSGLNLGPEIFQGRFKAVDTELKTVRKFYDPLAASLKRLQNCKNRKQEKPSSDEPSQDEPSPDARPPDEPSPDEPTPEDPMPNEPVPGKPSSQKQSGGKLPISKSTASLPKQAINASATGAPRASAGTVKPALTMSKSTTQIRSGGGDVGKSKAASKVKFSQPLPEMRENSSDIEEEGVDSVLQTLWDGIYVSDSDEE